MEKNIHKAENETTFQNPLMFSPFTRKKMNRKLGLRSTKDSHGLYDVSSPLSGTRFTTQPYYRQKRLCFSTCHFRVALNLIKKATLSANFLRSTKKNAY